MGVLLDAALQRIFVAAGEPVRFIQIGGNDGVHEDPLYQHHVNKTVDFEWGQVFEPIPEYFEMLSKNMAPFPYVTCHELAVDDADEAGTRQFNYVSPHDIAQHTLPPSSKGIGSFTRDRNALGGVGYGEAKFNMIKDFIKTIDVATIPAREVTARYRDANFLLTDCEGHDLEIIQAAFADPHFRPKLVQFEYLGHSEQTLKETIAQLQDAGYSVQRAGKDVVGERG
jgi:FkbM family methyltransferase